jgi:hypothetical protein
MKNYLGFGFLRRSTSCIHAVVRWQSCVKNSLEMLIYACKIERDSGRSSAVFALSCLPR